LLSAAFCSARDYFPAPMGKLIQDEFTGRTEVSRQRRWQLRQQRDGKCPKCGELAVGFFCQKHGEAKRMNYRKRQGFQVRPQRPSVYL
jgi:hypothetical protein